MIETRKVATGLMLVIAVCYTSPPALMAQSDNFDTDHTYWDGTTADVSGTIWDGVQGTAEGYVSRIDANQTNSGRLTMQITDVQSNGSTNNTYDTSALYVERTGNFDAKVQMPDRPADANFLTYSLGAWTADHVNAVHIDNILGTTRRVRFRDQVPPDEFEITDLPNQEWFRLTRVGNEFTGYYGSDGMTWTEIGSFEADYGDTLRVGPSAWNASNTPFTAQFDNFMIVPEPSTALLSLSGLLALAACQRRRKRV